MSLARFSRQNQINPATTDVSAGPASDTLDLSQVNADMSVAAPVGDQPERQLSRRELLRRAAALVFIASGITGLLETAQGMGFVTTAPEYADHPVVTEPINYGDMAGPSRAGHVLTNAEFPDSIGYGYSDDGTQTSTQGLVTACVNRTLAMLGLRSASTDGSFWRDLMYGKPGLTTKQIGKRIDAFRAEMSRPEVVYFGPWSAEVSMGGNDALNYFSDHMNPFKILLILSDFDGFLDNYRKDARAVIEKIAAMRQDDNLSDLQRINITGIPDIGKSKKLWFMRIPGVREIATAACKHMNAALVEVAEKARTDLKIAIHVDDIFDLDVDVIHPTRDGYRKAAMRRMSRSIGLFPDGERSFEEEAARYKVSMPEPTPEPTQSLNS